MSELSPPPLPQQKKPRGCFFYGAIIALLFLLVFGVGGYCALRYGIDKIIEFTEEAPMSLPASTMPAQDYAQLERRVEAFPAAARAATEPVTLVLSGDDLNALIAHHPDWRYLAGKVWVTLDGSDVRGDVSLPLGDLFAQVPGFSRLEGRYLNGAATLKVALFEGILVVKVVSLEIKGQSPSPAFMAEIQRRNLVQDAPHDAKFKELVDEFESIVVANGKLTITSKPKK